MEKYLPQIRKCPLFDGISDEDLLRMLNCLGAKILHFDKRFTVFAEGTRATKIGIVLSGRVQTIGIDYYGNRTILGEAASPNSFMEAFAVGTEELLPVSAVAIEPSDILFIEASHILSCCDKVCLFHRQLIYNLMKQIGKKMVELHRRSEIISQRTTRDKLLTYLYSESRKSGGKSFAIPFDRQELADYLEVDRSGLSTEIGKLKREGLIENEKNVFKLI